MLFKIRPATNPNLVCMDYREGIEFINKIDEQSLNNNSVNHSHGKLHRTKWILIKSVFDIVISETLK